jgi:multidrug efflux pump subunit AcrB
VIQTEAPGLSAELVERQVTQAIENALAGASGVEHIPLAIDSGLVRGERVVSGGLQRLP